MIMLVVEEKVKQNTFWCLAVKNGQSENVSFISKSQRYLTTTMSQTTTEISILGVVFEGMKKDRPYSGVLRILFSAG